MNAVQFGPCDDLGYRRPPATVCFADLRRRGLPKVLFVNSGLPEGVSICDVEMFAAMVEQAYHPPMALLMDMPDEHGNQLLRDVGVHGIGQWVVITPRPSGWRTIIGPERDGRRQVTVEAWTKERDYEEIGPTLATFRYAPWSWGTTGVRRRTTARSVSRSALARARPLDPGEAARTPQRSRRRSGPRPLPLGLLEDSLPGTAPSRHARVSTAHTRLGFIVAGRGCVTGAGDYLTVPSH